MTTWSAFLSDLRADLQDTAASPRWTSAMLYLYTKDGIRDYSTWFPKRYDRVGLTLVNGTRALPADFIEEIFVEYPLDTYLERRATRPGVKYNQTSAPLSYHVEGGSLYVSSPINDTAYLTYYACHPVPISDTDTTYNFTVPDMDIELIRLYVKGRIYTQMRQRQAALDRFKLGTGARDDNPLIPEVENQMEDYYRGIAQRVRGGVIHLYRTGRKK